MHWWGSRMPWRRAASSTLSPAGLEKVLPDGCKVMACMGASATAAPASSVICMGKPLRVYTVR
ncbi:hypothetical protein D3C72_2176540 [compost metagenome]